MLSLSEISIGKDTASRVATIIPCFNAQDWIKRAIESVLDQNYPDSEIVVIDDGSTDNSLNIIRSFDSITWETGPNRGACAARNRGAELTDADYLLFLDADDYLTPGSIAAWVHSASAADIVLGPFAFEQNGVRQATRQPHEVADAHHVLKNWLSGSFTPPCSVLWRRTFLLRIGGWNEGAVRNQDGELVIRALLEGARISVASRGLGVYVQHNGAERVSKRAGREVLMNAFETYAKLVQLARLRGWQTSERDFGTAYYRLAREAFESHIDDIGHLALRRARTLGLRGHIGSRSHRMFATVLGLRTKTRFSRFLRDHVNPAGTLSKPSTARRLQLK